jgi:hypothetical protein
MYLSSGYTKNVNKYQTLFILVIVRVLCVFTNYKTIENIGHSTRTRRKPDRLNLLFNLPIIKKADWHARLILWLTILDLSSQCLLTCSSHGGDRNCF